MQVPLQITFRHMEPSPALEARIRELAMRLEKFCPEIVRCRVVVEKPHAHQHQGELFDVTLDLYVPDGHIAIQRARPNHPAHQDVYVALRDAFRAARRKVQNYQRARRQEVKTHAEVAHGHICEIHPEQGFGRIETEDGRVIYFHKNSVLDHPFAKLTTGIEVRFAEESGDQGPQASTVHVVL